MTGVDEDFLRRGLRVGRSECVISRAASRAEIRIDLGVVGEKERRSSKSQVGDGPSF
jgi:hypothetical protein